MSLFEGVDLSTVVPPPGVNGAGGHADPGTPPTASAPDDAPGGQPDDPAAAEELRARLAAREAAKDLDKYVRSERYRQQAQQVVKAEAEAEAAQRRQLRLTPASAFRVRPVRWVWAGRMPVGEITLIPGREGAGKSTFLAWQAAQITRGTLPGMFHGQPRSVLYAATEDSWEYTIAPRMIAAGADMDRVFRIDVEHEEGRYGKLSLPADTRLIPEAAHRVEAAALMCDPVISIIDDSINTFKAQELRSALEPLKRAVEEAGIALAGLVHFNKTKDTDVLSMISGSRAWPEVARAVIAIAVDKDADEYTCVVSQVKNNLGRADLPHLTYTIRTHVITAADHEVAAEDVEIGRLVWTGESDRGVEDILSSKPEPELGDNRKAILAFVVDRYAATRQRVSVASVVEHFEGQITEANVRKTLPRCVKDRQLKNEGRGFYVPTGGVVKPCPGCGGPAEPGANFCRACARGLDAADRAAGGGRDDDDGRLW